MATHTSSNRLKTVLIGAGAAVVGIAIGSYVTSAPQTRPSRPQPPPTAAPAPQASALKSLAVAPAAPVVSAVAPPAISTPATAQAHAQGPASTAHPEVNLDRISLAPMLAKVLPAVVSIRVKGLEAVEQNPLYNHPLFAQLIKESGTQEPTQREFQSAGSGVVVDPARGLIMTNFHVIEKAKEIKIKLLDGRELVGKLLGKDAAVDLAAVQVEATDLVGLPIADSLKVRIGDFVVAIGNPLGLDATATMGMVSSLKRTNVRYREFESYIQHDASVNSGNSGGALVNLRGELIGINTAILSPSGGSVGLGFAIPSGMALHVFDQLVKNGRVVRGSTGVKTVDLTPEKAAELKLGILQGARITHVRPGSPADQGGAMVDDVITAVVVKGRTIKIANAAQLQAGEGISQVGEKIEVEVNRAGQTTLKSVIIGELQIDPERLEIPSAVLRLSGLVLHSLEADSPLFGEVRGAIIAEVKPGTLPQLIGLLAGDVITAIDQEKVRAPEDVLRLAKVRNGKFDIHLIRNRVPMLVKFPL